MHFTWEPSTSGRVLAPGPTLLGTYNRGNHGGIAPTQIGEPTPGKWTLSHRLRSVV
ncbi:thioredoxin [Prochlorothrix hollandica]|uniref:thioredoxin n=1 Tax=Prochlorothrix hollandica TaxID=1223 RepID=UPI0009DA5831|nr:thioredoxin [Prochlorothrix hollandica]